MNPIPFLDLAPELAPDRERYLSAFAELLDRGAFVGGSAVDDFEAAFAAWLGVRHVVAVSNGTSALTLALQAVGVGAGDEVLVPALSFFATAEAVVLAGARPVFCDVRDDTLTLDATAAAKRLTSRTRAIVPVHLYGQMASDLASLRCFARERGLAVVEDAAQAHGARADLPAVGGQPAAHGARAGTVGDAGAFSFYPSKNLGAFGEGGAVSTNRDDVAARVRLLREHGQRTRNVHEVVGTNARLNAITCACLSISLERVAEKNAARCTLARRYRDRLAGVAGVRVVTELPGHQHVHHLMVVRVASSRRDAVRERLAERGIATAVHYPRPMHLQPAFRTTTAAAGDVPGREGSCPVAERATSELISLPLYPTLAPAAVDRVVEELAAALR